MKETEFRIGNLISDENGNIATIFNILQSYCRAKFDNELEDQLLYYKFVLPIKLTKEWLIKFGFEKIDDYDDVESVFVLNEFYVRNENSKFIFGLGYQDYNKELDYVHQLQNLCFALTNTELCIK